MWSLNRDQAKVATFGLDYPDRDLTLWRVTFHEKEVLNISISILTCLSTSTRSWKTRGRL